MIWKIRQPMQDDAIPTARIHPDIYPCNRAVVVHMAKFPARLPRSRQPSQPALSYEHIENFTKDLEVRRDLRNRASPVNRAHVKRPRIFNLPSYSNGCRYTHQ